VITHRVIVVGGGPAGSSCAWRLVQAGVDCLVLDRAAFPRDKTCAGWITPRVLEELEIRAEAYPHGLTVYSSLLIHVKGIPVRLPGTQYAVRRREFDHWLLERSGAPWETHRVKDIQSGKGKFVLDGRYAAQVLIGAGGTHCPVYHQVFREDYPRRGPKIAALEEEFRWPVKVGSPRLWFFERGLPGYSWYVPKTGGFLNVGVGGNQEVLRARGETIREHWDYLIQKLLKHSLIEERKFHPQGYVYHLAGEGPVVQLGEAYLVGDAAGLATRDMGEGIGPAVASGLQAARSVLDGTAFRLNHLDRYSLLPAWIGRLLS